MTRKLIGAALTTVFLAAYPMQPVATMAGTPSPFELQVAAASGSASDAQAVPGKWIVLRVHCSDLLNASEDDRASAAMFYYGYLAARLGIQIIDVTKIADNIHKVMQQCEATPKMHITQAFLVALRQPHKR